MVGVSNGNGSDKRPSDKRREELQDDATSIPTVSNFFTLDRYYTASETLYENFEEAYSSAAQKKTNLNLAYVYGKRYCHFVLGEIPKHDYYLSPKFRQRKAQAEKRSDQILLKIVKIADWMDEEEIEREKRRQEALARQRAELEKKRLEKERVQREKEAKQIQELRDRVARQKQQQDAAAAAASVDKNNTSTNVEESALAKLQRLSQPIPPPTQPLPSALLPPKRVSFSDTSIASDGSVQPILPPPLLPPSEEDGASAENGYPSSSSSIANGGGTDGGTAAPPSYNQILGQSKNYFGQKRPSTQPAPSAAAAAVGGDPSLPSYDSVVKKQKANNNIKKREQQQVLFKTPSRNIRQHIAQCAKLQNQYQQTRQIQISRIGTHQGRVSGTTNGCTVISACMVSRHLETHGGITKKLMENVIDRDCIPLLRAIRSKLGLSSGALIIPSDVHDHLVDHKWLYQHKFVGAAGGNVTDPNHLGELFKMLQGEPNKTSHLKSAATFFFREHVIAIVKHPVSPTEAIYDVIDSLPTCNGGASLTRCVSLQALQVHMQKYTCNKFSDSNRSYIERNKWDDSMADFDPRVFQTFVWADLPKQ